MMEFGACYSQEHEYAYIVHGKVCINRSRFWGSAWVTKEIVEELTVVMFTPSEV